MEYTPTIGLEIHVELKTKTKMFCDCPNDPDEKHPNINICPVCLGYPGTLPVANSLAIEYVLKAGFALGCVNSKISKFDRKNYFYPDLPKGYQISQYDMPLCQNGKINIGKNEVRIRRIHLEEDTGRLLHAPDEKSSLIDFNRAGVPLMELVTEPDMHSAKEVKDFAQELQLIFRYIGVSDADMEKGQMRCEANISISPQSQVLSSESQKLGTKVEIKNLNSFKALERGIEYEINRQTKLLRDGKKVTQETRGWDENSQKTFSQRMKESAHDYRYFPEPDLPPLNLFDKNYFDLEKIKASLPELPQQKRERFAREFGLDEKSIEFFVQNKDFGDYLEQTVSEIEAEMQERSCIIKIASNYLISDVAGILKEKMLPIKELLMKPEDFAELIYLILKGDISSKIAKQVLLEMISTGEDPSHIVDRLDIKQMNSEEDLIKFIDEVIKENPQPAEDFKNGKEAALQFLIGQIMAKTKGRANPVKLKELLNKKYEH
jgi:aspartyl-tRNA(Asn)/glutamyl-tRNA(Gln) amidotransferase subunit B